MRGSLKDIDSDSQIGLDSLRKKYSLTSSDANTQRRYDAVLKQINFYEQFNKSMYKRAERVQSLQSLFANATTPQQKLILQINCRLKNDNRVATETI